MWRVVSGVGVLSRALRARDGRFVRERLKEDKLPRLGLLGRRGEAWEEEQQEMVEELQRMAEEELQSFTANSRGKVTGNSRIGVTMKPLCVNIHCYYS